MFFFFNFGFILFIYLFIFGSVGSSFLCEGSPQLRRAGATPHRGARASNYHGLSCCGAQAPDARAQQLWLTGPAAPRHVGSSQARAQTRVPCIGRQTLNHCATREARTACFYKGYSDGLIRMGKTYLPTQVSSGELRGAQRGPRLPHKEGGDAACRDVSAEGSVHAGCCRLINLSPSAWTFPLSKCWRNILNMQCSSSSFLPPDSIEPSD